MSQIKVVGTERLYSMLYMILNGRRVVLKERNESKFQFHLKYTQLTRAKSELALDSS